MRFRRLSPRSGGAQDAFGPPRDTMAPDPFRRVLEDIVSTRSDLAWWQKLLVTFKLWRPPHRTLHHEVRDMERPPVPPVTGAHGNRLDVTRRRRLVPQRGDD